MRHINLTKGKITWVSDHRYDYLNQWKWCVLIKESGVCYAVRSIKTSAGTKTFFMHRIITDAPNGMVVDHIDGDGLMNVDENLRVCTNAENRRNRDKQANNKTGFKGVSFSKGKYAADIRLNNKHIHVGVYATAIQAAIAYDRKAQELFGEFARLNFG